MILPFANCTTASDEDLLSIVIDLLSENGLHVSVLEGEASNGNVLKMGRSQADSTILIMVNERDERHSAFGRSDLAFSATPDVARAPKPSLERPNAVADAGKRVEVDRLTMDQSQRSCVLDGLEVKLTTGEFELLWLLAVHAGSVVSRQCLHQELLGLKYDGQDRSIDLRVSRLRKKLKDDSGRPQLIKSVRGVGYMLASAGH